MSPRAGNTESQWQTFFWGHRSDSRDFLYITSQNKLPPNMALVGMVDTTGWLIFHALPP
jgi:hypothetical protein